jgi:two-component system cell cycle response regulator
MSHTTCADQFVAPVPAGERCILVMHAPSQWLLGKQFRLPPGELVLGRELGCDALLDVPDVSRRHARVREAGERLLLQDLGSTNGTIVDGRRVTSCVLVPGATFRLGSVVLKYLDRNDLEVASFRNIRRLADEDSLTGLALRRVFSDSLEREVARSRRHGHPLCLALLDLDQFKELNDRHGHQVGDAVLCQAAARLQGLVRREQLLARVGGDELALLLPDVPLEKAQMFAERIRKVIERGVFGDDRRRVSITISIGVAAYRQGEMSSKVLFALADEHLYTAKRGGRNRIHPPLASGVSPGATPGAAQSEVTQRVPGKPGR